METVTRPRARRTRATVVFAELVGFTEMSEKLGVEAAYGAVTGCVKLLDGIARKYGGSVDKYQGDSLMVLFGYPVQVDAAARAALDATLEMRQRVYDYNRGLDLPVPLDIHIGVNTGNMVSGDIRGPVVREFHVLGDAVNVAARLKARAPVGAIYVGPETSAEAGDHFAFRPLAPLALKGKSQSVATYELIEATPRLHDPRLGAGERAFSTWVGHAQELERLRAHVLELHEGRGGLVALTGVEGIGKSRLLVELGGEPILTGVRVLQVRPPATGERRAGEMAAEIGLGLRGSSPEDEALAPALGERLAGVAADAPLLLALEDLQRAGPESVALIAELLPLAATHPILFLAVSRPEATGASQRLLEAAREASVRTDEIHLEPLTPDESRRLLDGVVEEPLDPAARALIEARAAGNPARIVLGAFLAPALLSESERVAERPDRSSEAERRRATILFADITGFTAMTEKLGAEQAYPIVAGCLRILDEVARRHGGTVDKYLGDCVMALFGVPEAIEDAPRAALNASIEMRRRVREYKRDNALALPLDVHIGIHTGQSIAGDISGPLIREFAVMGEPVVVASQLTDSAEAGEIFVGPEAWRLMRDRFEFRPREPLQIPGRQTDVAVYELLSSTEQLYRRRAVAYREIFSELVGRAEELARLQGHVAALSEGRGGVVTLVGEAGLGKSRLVEELRGHVSRDVLWLEGRSLSTGTRLSFHPFADLLRSWARIDDDDDDEGTAKKLESAIAQLLPQEVEEAIPFLGAVMGTQLAPERQARLASVQGDLLDRLIRARVAQILQRLSEERPLVLVFDDLHWADLSSIELLEAVHRLATLGPVLFLHVFRPHFAATSGRVLEGLRKHHQAHLEEIELRPLDREAIRLLINNLFRHADIPQRLRALITERASGNPFFVEEVVRSLVEEGAVERQGEAFRATERIHTAEIPGTVQEVVMARIDRLPLRQRNLIHAASVVGRSFHFDVLRQVFPDKDTLMEDVMGLIDGGFLIPWDRLRGVEFAFKHPLLQEVAYDSLLDARRRELHLLVGRAIEAALSSNLPGYHAMLAYHFGMGRDLERAEQSLFLAGDEASRTAASNEALYFFRQASKLYIELHPDGGDPIKRARLEKSVGLALHNRGQLIEAEGHLSASLRLLGESVPTGPWELRLRFARNLVRVMARLYLPLRSHRPAADVDREVIALMMKRAEAQTYVSPTRFVFDSIDTLARLGRVDPMTVPGAGGFYAGTVGIFTYGGLSHGVSRRFLARAEPLVRWEDVSEATFFTAMRHMHHFFAGDWSEAHRMDEALLQRGIRGMHLWSVVTYVQLLAEQHLRRGEFEAARGRMVLLDSIWETFDYDYAKTNHYWLPTLMALEQRRLPEAVRAAEAYYDEIPEDLLHILAASARSTALTLLGELEASEATLGRAAELVARAGFPPVYQGSTYRTARFLLDVVQLERAVAGHAAAGDARRRARRSARAAIRAAAKVAYRQPEVYRLEGRRAWLAGRRDAALSWWDRALGVAERLGMRPEAARTLHEAGLRLGEGAGPQRAFRGREPAASLSEARATYEALALETDLANLDRGTPP